LPALLDAIISDYTTLWLYLLLNFIKRLAEGWVQLQAQEHEKKKDLLVLFLFI